MHELPTRTVTLFVVIDRGRNTMYSLDRVELEARRLKHLRRLEEDAADPDERFPPVPPESVTIVSQPVDVIDVAVEVKGDPTCETAHAVWQCPLCEEWSSEEWHIGDELPLLLCCSRYEHGTQWFIGSDPTRSTRPAP